MIGFYASLSKMTRMILQSAALGLGAYLVIGHELMPGAMIASSIMMARALAPIEIAIANWRGFVAARDSLGRLTNVLTRVGTDPVRTALPKPSRSLVAENVAVISPEGKTAIVGKVNFTLAAGEVMGIIGPSGSGKTSLVRALVGVWRPAQGAVRVDGAALEQWPPKIIGPDLGYLSQAVDLFDGTVAENIARMNVEPDDGAVVRAARAAGAHEMILRLPDGYDTRIRRGWGDLVGWAVDERKSQARRRRGQWRSAMTTIRPAPRYAIRKLNFVGYAAMVVALGGFGGWASTTDIAGAVIASGNVVVETSAKKVQHLTGGIVGELLVRDGSEVETGQVLMRLDDTLTRANLGVVQSQLDLYVAREARLLAERDGLQNVTFPEAMRTGPARGAPDTAIAGEERLFQARREGREGQRAQLRERTAQIGEEIRGLTAQQESKDSEIKYIGEQLVGVSELYKKNLVTNERYVQLQRDQARLQGERGQLIADIARSRGKIAETELQILQLDQDFRTDVLKDLRETQAKIAELQERANAAADELRRIDIRAPQAGIVYQLQVHTIGGVIGKGDTVMQIAPRADALLVEAKIAPQDIDQIAVGASVRVRIEAGNRRMTPDLEGKVTVLSPDITRESETTPKGIQSQQYYVARVALAEEDLNSIGDLHLVPGMPADVYIRTEDRTPLDYLLKPLHEQIARTFSER